MGKTATEILKFVAGLVIVGGWAVLTLTVLLALQLMSLDEEWDGWGSVLAAVAIPCLAITTLAGGLVWLIFRPRR